MNDKLYLVGGAGKVAEKVSTRIQQQYLFVPGYDRLLYKGYLLDDLITHSGVSHRKNISVIYYLL